MWLTRSDKEDMYIYEPEGEGRWATDLKLSRGRSACCLSIGAVWQAAGTNLLGSRASTVV
jgi:hypothetical protein